MTARDTGMTHHADDGCEPPHGEPAPTDFLAAIHDLLADHAKVNGEGFGQAGYTDPGAFLGVLARHGFTLVRTKTVADEPDDGCFDQWAIVELMGHVRRAGRVDEQEVAGTGFIRLRIPDGEKTITQLVSPKAVYAITPTTEETARAAAAKWRPEPIQAWEIEPPKPARSNGDPWRSSPDYDRVEDDHDAGYGDDESDGD